MTCFRKNLFINSYSFAHFSYQQSFEVWSQNSFSGLESINSLNELVEKLYCWIISENQDLILTIVDIYDWLSALGIAFPSFNNWLLKKGIIYYKNVHAEFN